VPSLVILDLLDYGLIGAASSPGFLCLSPWLMAFGGAFGVSERIQDGKHFFREDGCCRYLVFSVGELPYFLYLYLTFLIIL